MFHPRGNKYHNKKTMVDGVLWDSKKEAAFYQELKLRQKARDIASFKYKERIILQPSFRLGGKTIREITYTPDFIVFGDGYVEFVDVKGVRTATFDLKWKMLQYKHRDEKNYRFTVV